MTTAPTPSLAVHLIQCDTVWEDKAATFAHVDTLVNAAGVGQAGLIVLPEMFDTGFSFNIERTADTDGTTLRYLVALARRTGCWVHGARTVLNPTSPSPRGLNRTTVVGPDGTVQCEYDKVHPFSYGRESEFFDPGRQIKLYKVPFGGDGSQNSGNPLIVGPAICYDLRFPELFRAGAARGAELFIVPANWPAVRQMHRLTLARARAIENQAAVICLNRSGRDPTLVYNGGSVAYDAKGELLGELGEAAGVLTVQIDPMAIRKWRADFPALRDRQADLYAQWTTEQA